MCEISVPLCSTMPLQSHTEPQHIVAGVIALITSREALSLRAVRVYTRRVSTSTKVCAARSKDYENIEEMIADVGFGFHAKVKVSFFKPEKVNMLIFFWKKCKLSPTACLV